MARFAHVLSLLLLIALCGCSSNPKPEDEGQPLYTNTPEISAILILADIPRGQLGFGARHGRLAKTYKEMLEKGNLVYIGGDLLDGEFKGYRFQLWLSENGRSCAAAATPIKVTPTTRWCFLLDGDGRIYRSLEVPERKGVEWPEGLDLVYDVGAPAKRVSEIPHPPE